MQQPLTKSQIITLRDWADVATALIRSFLHTKLEEYNHEEESLDSLSERWSIEDSTRWVSQLLDDEFNRQMQWSAGTDNAFDQIMIQMSERYADAIPDALHPDKPNKANYTLFFEDLVVALDPVSIIVAEFVSELIKPNPWWVWSLHARGDVVLVESDEDFRIKVFNEKVEAGEWSVK